MQQRVLRRLRVAAIESAEGQLFIGRMGVNVDAELVVHVQNGIPDLRERNLPTFGKKSWARPRCAEPEASCGRSACVQFAFAHAP